MQEDARSENNDAFRCACLNGHLELVKWIFDTFELTIDDARSVNNWAFRNACINCYLRIE